MSDVDRNTIHRAVTRLKELIKNRDEVAPAAVDEVIELLEQNYAEVILFKPGGRYYTTDIWRIPDGAIGPYDLDKSPDYRHHWDGPMLVVSQHPWGFPYLFPGTAREKADQGG